MNENNNVTSLSSPSDIRDSKYTPNRRVPPLQGAEADAAI